MAHDLASRFVERSQYYLGTEYPAKIRAALRSIPADRLWWRPYPTANSAGNLVLHLAGNLRQWVISGIGGAPDVRARDAEFAATDGWNHDTLLALLESTCREAVQVIGTLDAESLAASRTIQGRDTSVLSALYHVVEHFSGHTGQLIFLAKQLTPAAVQFYDDTDGLARPTFLPDGMHDVG
jgi:uncharacterized damage-inducible protein DinB